jgi:hypothetical protein
VKSTTLWADAGSRSRSAFPCLAPGPWLRICGGTVGDRRWPILALRAGILFGVAVGVERLTFVRLSSRSSHNGAQALAVGTRFGLYTGLLGLYWQRIRRGMDQALIVAAPLAPSSSRS